MEQLERIGISLDQTLLSAFDQLATKQGYQNRSEAIRDMMRRQISTEKLADPNAQAVAVVCLVFNHHSAKLVQKLTALGHSHLLQTICSMHVHLDRCDCMEVIVLKGRCGQIKKIAERLLSHKGVKLGNINMIAAEQSH
ncbi:MAG: nickel-responsive transcriptional regulator NikR [Sedimentisphaerales bacterium]|nr:nickel-responsive transcriptional regulator NikR [Sedimentisphaerales bacterium]